MKPLRLLPGTSGGFLKGGIHGAISHVGHGWFDMATPVAKGLTGLIASARFLHEAAFLYSANTTEIRGRLMTVG